MASKMTGIFQDYMTGFLPIMVRMMIHSKRIHLDSQTAALLNKLDPDKMNKLEGNSALSASVITALFRGIFVDLTGRSSSRVLCTNTTTLSCHQQQESQHCSRHHFLLHEGSGVGEETLALVLKFT